MPSQGPLSAGTGADDSSVGSTAWSGPTLVTASDDSRALASLGGTSHYLKATNFGFSIPGGATIDGIVVEVERSQQLLTGGDVVDNAVRIVKGGSIGATDRSAAGSWPTTDAYKTYGSSSDLWGESWTATDINGSTFGAAVSAIDQVGDGVFARIDHVRVTVYYTAANPVPFVSVSSVAVARSARMVGY